MNQYHVRGSSFRRVETLSSAAFHAPIAERASGLRLEDHAAVDFQNRGVPVIPTRQLENQYDSGI